MSRYIKREDAVFAACKVLDQFGACKIGLLCPDVGCSEVRDIIDTFQMIEIPDQHGRLVDADVLEKDAQKRMLICDKYDNQFQKPYEIMRAIALAPTIIPADEGET